MSLALKDRKDLELKKHINAIHCSNNLTLVQRKLFNALLFNAYPQLPYQQKFQIKGQDLSKLIGYHSKDTAKLKVALLGLITTVIEWNVIDCTTGQEKQWKATAVLASAELSKGICTYEYSQLMKDLLYQPEIYGRINMTMVAKFKSSYGLALYENCIRYQGLTQTPWFPLEAFRKLMGVFEDKYIVFRDFKKRVLDIAIKEVNLLSPIIINAEIDRVNQKVIKIRFKLSKNLRETGEIVNVLPTNESAVSEMLKKIFGLSSQIIDEIFSKYDEEYIRKKIEMVTQSESFISGKIRGLAGYFIEALRKDYQPSRSSQKVIAERRKVTDEAEKTNDLKQKIRDEQYNQYVAEKIAVYLSELSSEEFAILMAHFENYLKSQNGIFQSWYNKHKLQHPAVKALFNNYIKETKKEQIGEFLSIKTFRNLNKYS